MKAWHNTTAIARVFFASGLMAAVAGPAFAADGALIAEAATTAQTAGDQTASAAGDPQTDQAAAPAADEGEEVVVTGFRASLQKSLTLKREAVGIRDSIVAEDMGKFPDNNIAESLQRVPGIVLSRDANSNEGQRINIRGLGPNYVQTTINGTPVRTSSSDNIGGSVRTFDFDVFPSELFGRVDIYKTPKASLMEGGVSGNVDLQTPRPFDSSGQVLRLAASISHNTNVNDRVLPRANFIFSDHWGNFGVLFGAAYARNATFRGGLEETGNYGNAFYGTNPHPLSDGFGTAIVPFVFTPAGYFPQSANAPKQSLTPAQALAYVPRFPRSSVSFNERERLGFVGSVQFKNETLDLSLDGVYSRLTNKRDSFDYGFPFRSTSGASALVPIDVRVDENNNLQGRWGNTSYQVGSNAIDNKTRFGLVTARGVWTINDNFKFSGLANYSKSLSSRHANAITASSIFMESVYDSSTNPNNPTITSARPGTDINIFRERGAAAGLATNFNLFNEDDEQKFFSGEFEYKSEVDADRSFALRAGGSYTVSTKSLENRLGNAGANAAPIANGLTWKQIDSFAYMTTLPFSYRNSGGNPGFPTNWAIFPRSFIDGVMQAKHFNEIAPLNFSPSFEAAEKVAVGYVEAEATLPIFGRPLRTYVGLRYADTKVPIDNYRQATPGNFVPNQIEGKYSNWLPSASFSYDATKNVVLRGSAGKTLTRSALSQIAAAQTIVSPFDFTIRVGNPNLRPEKATVYDLAAEWYFQPGGILSVTGFRKSLTGTSTLQTIGTPPFNTLGIPIDFFQLSAKAALIANPATPMNLQSYVNLNKVNYDGLEFAYQQNFRFLPKPFDGFGAIASVTLLRNGVFQTTTIPDVTYVDGSGKRHKVNIAPKLAYSLTGFYEKNGFSVRASYNYSGRVGTLQNSGNGLLIWNAPREFLDVAIGAQLNDRLELRLEAQNLTNSRAYSYFEELNGDHGKSRLDQTFQNGRTFSIGFRAKL